MLAGYQVISAPELFVVQQVKLNMSLSEIISRPGRKAICEVCREEIINGREVLKNGVVLCRACDGAGYYHYSVDSLAVELLDHIQES